jgi:NitT/TauT family transport system permease protein
MKPNRWENRLLRRLAWIAALGIAWQLTAAFGKVNPALLPPPRAVWQALAASWDSGEMIRAIVLSLWLIGKGLLIGTAAALLLAALGMTHRLAYSLVDTMTALAHPLPGIAMLPVIILWLGTGSDAVIFIIVHSVVWPLVLNLLTGFRSIPRIYREIGQNLGLDSARSTAFILIPASFPYLLAGLKIGWARAWRALISAEMIFGAVGGEGGLGWFIFKRRVFMDTAGIFAGMLIIVLIGILVEDLLFESLEQNTVKRWGMTV